MYVYIDMIYLGIVLRARCKKQIQETKIWYFESQQKALLKFNNIY